MGKKVQKFMSAEVLSSFCGQLAMIIKAGLPVTEGLSVMQDDSNSLEERAILAELLKSMEESGSLRSAMAQNGCFPEYMHRMIGIGEETGTLGVVISKLQNHYERETSLRRSISSAISYPATMLAMMIAVIVVLLTKVMPLFNRVFMQLGTEMSGVSLMLMNLGTVINRYGLVFVAILAVLVALLLWGALSVSGKAFMKKLGYAIPFTRKLYEKIALCRFAGTMALTLRSGLNTERSIELAAELSDDPCFDEKLSDCTKLMDEDDSLSKALCKCGIFSGMYSKLSAVGERTGSMDSAMEQIAVLCQDEVDTKLHNLVSIIEPTLVVVLSVIVGIILLSVMLPLMGIMAGI